MPLQHAFTYDNALLMKDAGAVTADGAATVSAAAAIMDLGLGRVDATVMFNCTAIDVSSGDERYILTVQGSNSSTFASGIVNLASKQLGDSSVTLASADDVVGLYEIPFTNELLGTLYRYVRLYIDVSGTTPSINGTAYMVKNTGAPVA